MKIFMTGGTGFIGSHIAVLLANQGHSITILARNKQKVPALLKYKNISIVEGTLAEFDVIEENLKGVDAVILVALVFNNEPGSTVLLNDTFANVKIAELAEAAGVKKLIYTSSTSCNDNVYMIEQNKIEGKYKKVDVNSKQHPSTTYGATKAATENFLLALTYQSEMKINIVRPGYVFGNPIVEGASTQSDTRFRDIVEAAIKNNTIEVVKMDGTQFIYASNLAKLYNALIDSEKNRETYFGLANAFLSWEEIAYRAIELCNSKSKVNVEDRNWDPDGTFFDVSDMKKDFGLEFSPWEMIDEHINYYINQLTN